MGLYKEVDSSFFKRNWLLNQSYFDELASWNLDQSPSPIEGVILKGGHLIPKYYSHPGERFMGDIDILISDKQLYNWVNFLKEKGFKDITKDSWSANDFKKILLKKSDSLELVIELHTRLFFQEKKSSHWKGEISSPFPKLSYLCEEELFVHLCGHLAYQHTFLSLHWLYDIYLLVKSTQLDPKKIERKAKSAQVWRSCQIIALILKEKLNVNIPQELLPGPITSLLIGRLITDDFLIHAKRSPLRYFLIKHLTKDHLYQALIYDLSWLQQRRSE